MEHLRKELYSLLAKLPEQEEIRSRLASLKSRYPFNEYEYLISTLLAMNVLTLDGYHDLRESYVARNRYLHIFELSSQNFGGKWAENRLKRLVPELQKPSRESDPEYSGQYDLYLDGIRIEVKASRAVDKKMRKAPLYKKALASDSNKEFLMNFQQMKTEFCDVFVWVAVWRDVIRYWVLSSNEVATNRYYSPRQHRGNIGEGQLHIRHDNIRAFAKYKVKPKKLKYAIRMAHKRQAALK